MPHHNDDNDEVHQIFFKVKKSLIYVGFFSFFINLLQLASPLYMLQLYDRVMISRSESTLLMLTLIIIILFMTMMILEIVRSRILVRISNKIDNMLSDRIFESIFMLSNKSPDKVSTAPFSDLALIRQALTGNGLFAIFDAPWFIIYISALFIFHSYFGWFSICAGLLLILFAFLNERQTKKKLIEANKMSRSSHTFLEGSLRNSEIIYAMGMQDNIRNLWQKKYFRFLNAQMIASDNAGFWVNITKSTRLLLQSLILGLGGFLALRSEITPGMMIAGSIMMGRALAPLDVIISSWKGFSQAYEAYIRLKYLLKEHPKKEKPMVLPPPKGEISLEQIIVIPPNTKLPTIKGISLHVKKGDVVGIIGPSAAGKSTLARAILGIWPVVSGKVRLDMVDITQLDRELLGEYIGYLPQDIELFEGTISENISRFSEVNASKVVEAATQAGVHEMILKLPNGYDTQIGKGGSILSSGQRQRIGLARALYGNPVIVVLDEPNSNLDDAGEYALTNALRILQSKAITVILITQRPSIVQMTNKLMVLNQGKIELYGDTQHILQKLQMQATKV